MALSPQRERFGGFGLINPDPVHEVEENENAFDIYTDACGMEPSEIDLDFEPDTRVLTIRGTHPEKPDAPSVYHRAFRSPRTTRTFAMNFTVPQDVELDGIAATLENGLLNVHIPKMKSAASSSPTSPSRFEQQAGISEEQAGTSEHQA